MTETNTVSTIHDRNTTAGPAALAICNAMTGALKQSCGKGPTKVKAYTMPDHVAVVVRDMLTTLERTLVQNGHEQLVSEARQMLVGRAAKDGPRVAGAEGAHDQVVHAGRVLYHDELDRTGGVYAQLECRRLRVGQETRLELRVDPGAGYQLRSVGG